MHLLKYIRSRSASTKTQYAFWFAVITTSIIGVVWITTLPAQFSGTVRSMNDKSNVAPPGFKEIINDAKEQVANTIDAISNVESPSATTNMDFLRNGVEERVEGTESDAVEITGTSASGTREADEVQKPRIILIATTTSQKSE